MRPWKPLRPTSLDASLPTPVRRARRPVRIAAVVVIAVVLGASQFPDGEPEVVGMGGRVGDATVTSTTVIPAGARHLDPTQARPGLIATTTTTTAAPIYGPDNPSDYLVIDQGTVYRVPRTPLTSQLLWLATKGQ